MVRGAAQYSNHGATNCGFYSFEQCRATVSGIGGFCMRNPFSPSAAEPRRRYRRWRLTTTVVGWRRP
jgi:Protein of unknown function (DUF3551)